MFPKGCLRRLWVILLSSWFFIPGVYGETIELYVGHNESPRQDGSVKYPFADIHSALKHVLKIREGKSEPFVTINIQPGEYHLTSPIVISPALSNVHLKGAGTAEVRLKGSVLLKSAWEKYNANVYVASVSGVPEFDQLVVNGKTQVLARYPNYNETTHYWQGYAADAVSKERIKTWKHPEGAILHAMHKSEWGDFHYVITGIGNDGEPVLKGGFQNNRVSELHKTYRMVENVMEELDSPGEWFFDKEKQLLYYWPTPGIDVHTARFEGAVLNNLITIKGSENQPVHNVSITGMTIEQSRRTFMETYEPLLRSDWCIYRGGAVYIEGAEDCTIRHCQFTALGGNAVFISRYNRDVYIVANLIHDCGASAICFVGDASAVRSPLFEYHQSMPFAQMDTVRGPANNLYPSECEADNNLIFRIGRIEKQSAGVEISMAKGIRVSNNSIYDVPRAGINIGDGTWGGHIIEYNDIFKTVQETSDHGAFNSWGRDRFWHPNRQSMDSLNALHPGIVKWDAVSTTIIRNNRFRCDHGWDIDLDDGSSNYHIYNNLCLNGGIKLREGFYRKVENNIMINNGFHPHLWFANSHDVFCRNIVSTAHKDIRLKSWGDEVDYNLFPSQAALTKARANGVDRHSLFGDPRFLNPETGEFSVREGSPALNIGFENFRMDRFGVKDSALQKIAEKADIPVLMTISDDLQFRSPVADWLGARIKNVESMAERSAAGLSETAGVIILEANETSQAFKTGVRKGDVIISAAGQPVNKIQDLMKLYQQKKTTGELSVVIFRNQAEERLTIRF
ncbi:MAG: PDZ domain-containing protein [Bacteroidota bacterium]|nr:PDZ domain-containing protein [Bacteroidota bacterium]